MKSRKFGTFLGSLYCIDMSKLARKLVVANQSAGSSPKTHILYSKSYCALHISVWFVSGDYFFLRKFLKTTLSLRNRTTISGKACLRILLDIMFSSLHIQALSDWIWLSFCEETRKKVHLYSVPRERRSGPFRVRVHLDSDWLLSTRFMAPMKIVKSSSDQHDKRI